MRGFVRSDAEALLLKRDESREMFRSELRNVASPKQKLELSIFVIEQLTRKMRKDGLFADAVDILEMATMAVKETGMIPPGDE